MIKTLLTTAALLAMVASASAETYTYACQVTGEQPNPNNTYLRSAVMDTTKKTITWRGVTYKNAKSASRDLDGEQCAKYCFGNDRIMISTATQGVATLSVIAGSGRLGEDALPEEFECDAVRK